MRAKYNSTARAQGEPRVKSVGMERYWAAAYDMARAVILVDGKMYQRNMCLDPSVHESHFWHIITRDYGQDYEKFWCAGRVNEAT